MEIRIIELEKKSAFHEHIMDELNSVIIDQQKRIERLEKELSVIRDQLEGSDHIKKPEEETPPPHY